MRKISEILQDRRIELGLSIEQIVRVTKIKKEYLIAIEDGRYHDLPSESYALGFIKNYASYIGINKNKAAALFRREYEGRRGKILPTFEGKNKKVGGTTFLTPRNVIIGLVVIVILGYIAIQYNSYFFGPGLEIASPKENLVVTNNIVEVEGKTDPYATVLINNEESYVSLDGTFKKTIYLFSGQGQITIDARNRNGKDTKKVINVNVR